MAEKEIKFSDLSEEAKKLWQQIEVWGAKVRVSYTDPPENATPYRGTAFIDGQDVIPRHGKTDVEALDHVWQSIPK